MAADQSLNCCTPGCEPAHTLKVCAPRPGRCFHRRRCSAKGICRPAKPSPTSKLCGPNSSMHCDGRGNCIAFRPGHQPKNLVRKFNLAELKEGDSFDQFLDGKQEENSADDKEDAQNNLGLFSEDE